MAARDVENATSWAVTDRPYSGKAQQSTDINSWPAFNAIYAAWAGGARPARAVVPVPALHYGFKIEIEAVAVQHAG